MVKLVSLYLLGTHKQNFQYSMLNFSRTCFFFRSSFSLTVFIKFFLTQKSKSRKNWGILSRGKLSGPNYLWGNHPRTNYPEGNDPGQFSGEIVRGSNCLGGTHPGGNYQGAIFSGDKLILFGAFSV